MDADYFKGEHAGAPGCCLRASERRAGRLQPAARAAARSGSRPPLRPRIQAGDQLHSTRLNKPNAFTRRTSASGRPGTERCSQRWRAAALCSWLIALLARPTFRADLGQSRSAMLSISSRVMPALSVASWIGASSSDRLGRLAAYNIASCTNVPKSLPTSAARCQSRASSSGARSIVSVIAMPLIAVSHRTIRV
jgi:hypothetical protein